MEELSQNAKAVLSAYAEAAEPMPRNHVVESLLPAEPTNWGSRAHQEWLRYRKSLERAATTLEWRGLIQTVPGDGDPCVISDAGRKALAMTATAARRS